MNKDVLVRMEATQRYPGQEPERTVTEVKGEYYLRNQAHYVMFEEHQEGFTEKTKSMLKIKKNSVELTKKGLIHSHMFFEKQGVYATEYKTPFGGFLMEIHTKQLVIEEASDEMRIEIEYALKSQEQPVADCHIQIKIKEKQSEG